MFSIIADTLLFFKELYKIPPKGKKLKCFSLSVIAKIKSYSNKIILQNADTFLKRHLTIHFGIIS